MNLISRIRLAAVVAAISSPVLFADPQFLVSLSMTKAQINSPTPPSSGLFLEGSSNSWRHLGGDQIKWVNCANRHGKDTYLLGCGNGILRSTDAGQTWRVTTGWDVADVLGLEEDTLSPDTYYAATGWGVWKSVDAGANWTEASRGLHRGARFVQTVAESKSHPTHLLIGTAECLYASDDGGGLWTAVADAPKAPVLSLKESPVNPDLWLMGTESSGIFVSTDDGHHWKPSAEALKASMAYGVSLSPSDAKTLAASTWQDGVFVSTDGADHWRDITSGLPTKHVTQIAYDLRKPNRLWAAVFEAGLFWTEDNGVHWTMAGLDGADILELRFSN